MGKKDEMKWEIGSKTVRMTMREENRFADVHPDEVDNWKCHGWEVVDGSDRQPKN